MHRFVVVAALVAATTAHAEPHKKSRTTAQMLSGIGAGVSGGLILTSFLTGPYIGLVNMPLLYTGVGISAVGPSLGEWYAGEYLSWGMGVRAIAGATAIVIEQTQSQTAPCASNPAQQCTSIAGAGVALLGITAIAYVGGIAYDVIDAGDAVDRYNHAHGFSVDLTPMVLPTPNGSVGGLMLSGRW
jgi:hypothetical protein